MTLLTRSKRSVTWLFALALLTVPLAGCLDSDDSDDDPGAPGPEGFKVFLAALGDAPGNATATVTGAEVTMNATNGAEILNVHAGTLDLAELSSSGQAILVASKGSVDGEVRETTLRFANFSAGNGTLGSATLSIPTTYDAGEDVEVTVTLDLEASADEGDVRFDNLVAERDGTRIHSITRTELEASGQGREELPPLPTPLIGMSAAEEHSNDTAPSFHVNDAIQFAATLPEGTDATVREVFWSFGDGTTKTGQATEHTFRAPGLYLVQAILEGERGRQVRANTTVDIYVTFEDEGNVGVGTMGSGVLGDDAGNRDVKDHPFELTQNITNLTLFLVDSPSGGICAPDETGSSDCAPGNVFVELYDPNGELLGEDRSDQDRKYINVTGLMDAGTWTVRVKGDEGAAVGYRFDIEAHFLGLCEEFGGPATVQDCPDRPQPVEASGSTFP